MRYIHYARKGARPSQIRTPQSASEEEGRVQRLSVTGLHSAPAIMQTSRYETIGRDTHRHGRVSCLMDVDLRQRKLFVSVVEAKGLAAGLEDLTDDGAQITVRTQLLPSKNPIIVHEVWVFVRLINFSLHLLWIIVLLALSLIQTNSRRSPS